MSRKSEGANNRAKARQQGARRHAKVADARREFHHRQSTKLIRDNQAIYVEDLAVNGLARTRLARSVHDAGWSSFATMLEYEARMHGQVFHRIGRWFPSSKLCSKCGAVAASMPLDNILAAAFRDDPSRGREGAGGGVRRPGSPGSRCRGGRRR
ncbi:transposase [Microbispora sp. NPDC046973]|uniref:RNA-guided endonuclease InsQ/TnpB family protein n=1 Tax=Microbispora sp. NPDC046973 TaxID=3155022 RepID=UPI0033D1AC62